MLLQALLSLLGLRVVRLRPEQRLRLPARVLLLHLRRLQRRLLMARRCPMQLLPLLLLRRARPRQQLPPELRQPLPVGAVKGTSTAVWPRATDACQASEILSASRLQLRMLWYFLRRKEAVASTTT